MAFRLHSRNGKIVGGSGNLSDYGDAAGGAFMLPIMLVILYCILTYNPIGASWMAYFNKGGYDAEYYEKWPIMAFTLDWIFGWIGHVGAALASFMENIINVPHRIAVLITLPAVVYTSWRYTVWIVELMDSTEWGGLTTALYFLPVILTVSPYITRWLFAE